MVHDTDIVELELKSKKFSLSVRKKEALEKAEPVYHMVSRIVWRAILSALHFAGGARPRSGESLVSKVVSAHTWICGGWRRAAHFYPTSLLEPSI